MRKVQQSFYTTILFLLMTQTHMVKAEQLHTPNWLKQNQAVLPEELDQVRGMGGVVDITTYNNIDVDGVLTGNTATNNVSGSNIIDHGSFSDASGFVSVIQNTGNNVLIQDTTLVNVSIFK